MNLGVLVCGVQMLKTAISSWWIFPFMNILCPSLSFLISFGLKSLLSVRYESSHMSVHLLGISFSILLPSDDVYP